MQTNSKPTGWLKLFLLLSITGGILICLYSFLWIFNSPMIGIGLLACGAIMVVFGCSAWSAFKKSIHSALSLSKGCIIAFFLLVLFLICYSILDCLIYDKGLSSYFGLIVVILLFTIIWCGVWWSYLSKSKQVKAFVHSKAGNYKPVRTTLTILAFGLMICSMAFYIQESNSHYARELRFLSAKSQVASDDMDEEDYDFEDDSSSQNSVKHSKRAYSKSNHNTKTSNASDSRTASSNTHAHNTSSSKTQTKPCDHCHSTGIIQCSWCDGNGHRMAPNYEYNNKINPIFWFSYKDIECNYCKGTGKIKCGMCGGRGSIKINNSSTSLSHPMPSSGSYNSSGTTYYDTSSSSSSDCRVCGGSGVCTSCHGTGGHWEDVGYYVGEDVKSWIDCPSCRGSKKCYNCYGSGRQR